MRVARLPRIVAEVRRHSGLDGSAGRRKTRPREQAPGSARLTIRPGATAGDRTRNAVHNGSRGGRQSRSVAGGGPAAGYGRVLVNGTLSVRHRSPGSCSGSIANRRGPAAVRAGQVSAAAAARAAIRRSARAARTGPESKHAAASAITTASAPAGSGRNLSRRPRRVGNDRRIRPTPAAARQRCPRLSASRLRWRLAPGNRQASPPAACSLAGSRGPCCTPARK